MDEYKYKVIRMRFNQGQYSQALQRNEKLLKKSLEIEEFLNEQGGTGWELCGILDGYAYIFKKKIEQ